MTLQCVVATAIVAVAQVVPQAIAEADTFYQFQSPSGNIDCGVGVVNESGYAGCEIREHTWDAPPRPPVCEGGWGDRIDMQQGSPATLSCHTDTLRGSGLPTLPYGTSTSTGPITCDSETSGMTCTDTSTGHYFRIARESYEIH